MTVMTARPSSASTSAPGSVKKMIRDTTRLLNRPNLPADLRREQERKLAALQVTLVDREQAECEREMAVKYRMVKFFERKKALRRLASAQATQDSAAVACAQLDLAYILHFPKDRKYISLYPTTVTSSEVLAEREAIRKEISEKLSLLGAETMLSKVNTKKTKMALKGSEESEDDEEDESDDSEDEEEDEDSEDSGSEDSKDEDSDDSESDDSEKDGDSDDSEKDGDSDDSDDFDTDTGLSYDEDDSDSEDDSDDSDSDDSEDEDSEEEDSEEEDENSNDSDSNVSESDDDEDDDEEDVPVTKKIRH